MNTNDDVILELKNKIEKKKEKLNKVKKFNPSTNCIIELDGKNHNIRVMSKNDLTILLIKLNSYKISANDLNISECSFSGFPLVDWISDIKQNIDFLSKKSEREKLKSMENKLKTLLTNEKKVQLEVEELTNIFESM